MEHNTYAKLIEAQGDRQRRLAGMGEMATRISRTLKNPLASLALSASLLKRDLADDPDSARVADQMERTIQVMDYLLSNFVTFVDLPAPRPGPLVVSTWLDDTAAQLQFFENRGNISIRKDYGHRQPEIVADAELLSQMALNIVLNAVQSMSVGGELLIATHAIPAADHAPELLAVQFRDTGEGIAEENLDRIFDPFFTTRSHGHGLGLAIVHHIVQIHGGFVEVESFPGAGATFSVFLPV